MRFGVLGCGVIGELHARVIASLGGAAELVAVADTEQERARKLAATHGADVLETVADLAGRPDIDAISVCLPSGLHAEAAVAALEAGKHVVVEKPIDITLAAADRILDAERRSGRTVAVISQRRFQPVQMFVREAIESGRLGRITSGIVENTFWRSQAYYDSAGWRGTWALDGGGALMNQGVHGVDLLVWMLGEPVEVTAFAGVLAHERIEVEDTVAATVRFASGAIGTITATTAAYPGRTVRLLVNGDKGIALVENEELAYFHALDREPADSPGTGDTANQAGSFEKLDFHDGHRAHYVDFMAAVHDGRRPRVTSADARTALAVVLAVYESARAGGRPVPVR